MKDQATKVLLATHFFPPGHPGGTESYTYGLARTLLRKGHAPHVICAEGWGTGDSWLPRFEDSEYEGIPVRRLFWNWERASDPFVQLYDNHATEHEFASYLRDIQPDVVHITSCYALGAGIIRVAHRMGVPVLLTLTDFWFLCPRHTLLRGDGTLCPGPESAVICAKCMAANSRVFKTLSSVVPPDMVARGLYHLSHYPILARQRGFRGSVGDAPTRFAHLRAVFDDVDVPIAPSRFLRDMFGRNGYPSDRIRYSPYGMDLSWLKSLRPRAAGTPPCFGYIGQIDPLKGVDVLVRAFRLAALPDSVTLDIYGDMTKQPLFADRIRQLAQGCSNIRFKGAFTRSQVADVLSEIDVVVVPSMWYENTPLVIAEAFAAGKPVIATNLGGMSEVVEHGVNGLLFEWGDAAGLANAIRLLGEDPVLREQLARQVPQVRTIEAETEELLWMYRDAAASETKPANFR